MDLIVHPFLDPRTQSRSYVVVNPGSRSCAVIDLLPDQSERIVELVAINGFVVEWILATRSSPDGASAARQLQHHFICAQTGAPAAACAGATAGVFDRHFENGDRLCLGHACGRVLTLPSQGPGACCYVFDDLAFPGGLPCVSSSGARLLGLPEQTRLLTTRGANPLTHVEDEFAGRLQQRDRSTQNTGSFALTP